MRNILLGVTGSVAAIKVPELYNELKNIGYDVKVVATKSGKYFLDRIQEKVPCHFDEEEWPENYILGDNILHIELRRWASCLVIAPLDMNTLAKASLGLCDNLLTSVIRAWDWNKPVFICPAANTLMWQNDPTYDHVNTLLKRGAILIHPIEKKLACNDVGMGAMSPISTIIEKINNKLRWQFPLINCSGIPINHHPGAFGFHRRKNFHTGVDLYTYDGEPVYAVEDGTVVKIDVFTGPKAGHEWWEETYGMMVEGSSGVVNYGEIYKPNLEVGDTISRKSIIGHVKRVLFKEKHRFDIPGHSCSMLHLELYKTGTRDFADWHDLKKNPELLDPTSYLITSEHAPKNTLTWENPDEKPVG